MSYEFYITPDDYEQAEKNGVSRDALTVRIRTLGWGKSKAINTPTKQYKKIDKHWLGIAESNGINYYTFRARIVDSGWSQERAATEPLCDKEYRIKNLSKIRKGNTRYPKELVELAESNGIGYATFKKRVSILGWDIQKAATKSVMEPGERAKASGFGKFLYGKKLEAR